MKHFLIFSLLILSAITIQGCGKIEVYGDTSSQIESTAIADILTDPASFDGKTVKVSGKITTECPTGCWFDVAEGAAEVRVDIAPAGIAIPQRVGKTVVVEGILTVKDNIPTVNGKGVEIK